MSPPAPAVTVTELRAKKQQLLTERDQLHDKLQDDTSATKGVLERVENLDRGVASLNEQIDRLNDAKLQRIAAGAASSDEFHVERGSDVGSGYTDDDPRPAQVRDEARRTLDALHARTTMPTGALTRAEQLLNHPDPRERKVASDWVRTTGNEHYEGAFLKLMADPTRGHLLWTEREASAFRDAELVRAMSLTDASGGFLVPAQLDPSILITSGGSINPLRRISREVIATGDVWTGVSSAGSTAEWIAEATQVADASPTLAAPQIVVHKYDVFLPYSFEIGMDGANFLEEIGTVMADAVDQLHATAFTLGTGTGQPFGIITALVGGASIVASATTDVFARADVYNVQNALPPRFSDRAQWCANIAVLNLMSQMETTAGARLFPELSEGRLLNKPIHELSNMDGTVTAAADNYILLYGAFDQYVVASRIGSTLELIPNLVGAAFRPTGQRGAFLWGRLGADSLVDNAFRLLNVT